MSGERLPELLSPEQEALWQDIRAKLEGINPSDPAEFDRVLAAPRFRDGFRVAIGAPDPDRGAFAHALACEANRSYGAPAIVFIHDDLEPRIDLVDALRKHAAPSSPTPSVRPMLARDHEAMSLRELVKRSTKNNRRRRR